MTGRVSIARFLVRRNVPDTMVCTGCGSAQSSWAGTWEIWSDLQSGTEIEVTVPPSTAYDKTDLRHQ